MVGRQKVVGIGGSCEQLLFTTKVGDLISLTSGTVPDLIFSRDTTGMKIVDNTLSGGRLIMKIPACALCYVVVYGFKVTKMILLLARFRY